MAKNEIHVGDIGTTFRVLVKDGSDVVDISSATTKQILFTKPSTDTLTKDASFTTDGSDGLIEYDTLSGDLDESGIWKIQAYLVLSGGSWHSDIAIFKVHGNL